MASMVRTLLIVLWTSIGVPLVVLAQTTSTLSGRVTDATTSAPLAGATIQLFLGDSSTIGGTTDASGAFRLTDVPTGIHSVRASFVGYAAAEIAEVWVRRGKEEVVSIALQRSVSEIAEVEVRASAPQRMNTLSAHTLTVEQSLRYPATFFDPARLAMSFAGVASTNDQANHFSVRGNGPASNAWLLEGAEIVNPNHLTNAGTASDYPTLSGGGTTILSAQMLGTSRLLMGGLTAPYGNALGGLMDLQLRPGITTRQAFTVQAGLIGIDLSAEGPFRKGGKASYLINYRYSTLGLLSAMGVALGDEAITFQDLSFNVNLPLGDRALLTLFGMGGNSSNRFDAKDSTEWEFDKDSQNIDYTAKVGAAGGTLRLALGNNAVWRTTAVISENDQERSASGPSGIAGVDDFTRTAGLTERKLSLVSFVRGSSGARLTYQLGGSAMERTVGKDVIVEDNIVAWLIRPYAQLGYAFSDRLRAEVGLAYSTYTANGSSIVEPRASLQWEARAGRTFTLFAGQRGQLPNVQLFPTQPIIGLWNNNDIGLTRSLDLGLSYEHALRPHLIFRTEVYHQQLEDVPEGDVRAYRPPLNDDGNMMNAWDQPLFLQLANTGTASNTGLEVSLHHTFRKDLFYEVNATLLDTRYRSMAGQELATRWNTSGMGNVVIGREFAKEREGSKRTWGVNGRANVTGGQRTTPIDTLLSASTGTTVYDVQRPLSEMLATYYRIDLRIYRKMERKGHTGMWSLDLLNVTNAQNEAYHYYDQRKGEVVTKYQLGLIPNLSYRIEF
jgi:hypothetical protein